MSIFSRSKLATALAGVAVIAAGNALAADRTIDGVVKSVDYQRKSVTVTDKAGELYTYAFTDSPKIDVNGDKTRDLRIVKPGQDVTLKLRKIEKEQPAEAVNLVKGEILEINREQNLALVRPADGSAPRVVELPANVTISGLHKGAGVKDLQEGHIVTLKFTAL